MFKKIKEKEIKEFLEKYKDSINDISELTSGEEPTNLFYLWIKVFGYLLDNDASKTVSSKEIEFRKKISPLIHKIAPATLSNHQVIENRNRLLEPDKLYVPEDKGIVLPDEPVIWVANHAFKDDTLASVLAQSRQASILFGSLPQFYNTMDGLTAWLVGIAAMVNRCSKASRHSSFDKCVETIKNGGDLFIFPEGAWNRTPNRLMIDLWPGVYRIAKATGAKVVPMAHYISDCAALNNPDVLIHTVVDDPIKIDDLEEEEALQLIREKIGTWFYLMMEQYGQSTREKELEGFESSHEAWTQKLKDRIATVNYYDLNVENKVSYKPSGIVNPEDVWEPIANLSNDENSYAKKLVKTRKQEDYQNNFYS